LSRAGATKQSRKQLQAERGDNETDGILREGAAGILDGGALVVGTWIIDKLFTV